MNKALRNIILIVLIVVVTAIGLAIWLKSLSPEQVTPDSSIRGEKVFIRPGNYITGNTSAKVVLIEFGDFQCPACAANYTPIKAIVNKYKSNPGFNFVYRNFPLSSHANAKISANAAEAAGSQGKYWEMMDLLFKNQSQWAGSINPMNTFIQYAQSLGLDIDKFKDEVSTSHYINKIMQDYKDGEVLGVNGTPTFFLNGERLGTIADLDNQIQALLDK
ncbi:MAG: DsbA family protein [Candidatus Doudnabacteria bacterium]|nr:DsbA family protein [Candidatus Doudnabacteria bacterium]